MPKYTFHYENRGYLTLMVGPSGAGKTTFVNKYVSLAGLIPPGLHSNPFYVSNLARGEYPIWIVSPGDIRKELTGDRANQQCNKQVFKLAHMRVAEGLASGNHIIFDATNLLESARAMLASLAGFEKIQYIVLDRPDKKPWHGNLDVAKRHELLFKEQLPRILAGDYLGTVLVHDLRIAPHD